MPTLSLKEQQLKLREDVILQAVNRLLAQKGYDLMTVDEVAAAVGLAKPSLYRQFSSKESLAAAAMVRLLDQALATATALPSQARCADKLRALLRWALNEHLHGAMPLLPTTRSALGEALLRHDAYVQRLTALSELLGGWISEAQAAGDLAGDLPVEVVLFTLYARTCDPVLDHLKAGGAYSDEQIVDLLEQTTFGGLEAPGAGARLAPAQADRPTAR
jgi:TetR/AcrR family transcriptional regulator of autoinduction and epiphytic fitness